MNIQIINPIEYPGWDDLLLTNSDSNFFHTSAWAQVLNESYNYKPFYFMIIEDGKLLGLIPIMEVDSPITGKRGVSLPFTDYCRPISKSENHFREIFTEVINFGKELEWKYVELRGGQDYLKNQPPIETFFDHGLDIATNSKGTFRSFRSNTQRNIKRALKTKNIEVSFLNTWEAVKSFYGLHCMTRKAHGLPPQPILFFQKLFEHIISKGCGHIVQATFSSEPIASAVYLLFGDKAVFKYGASNKKFLHLKPNNLVMWEAIKNFSEKGFKYLSFGRTEQNNEGLRRFKRGWGTRESTLNYYRYDLEKHAYLFNSCHVRSFYPVFKYLPVPVLKMIGARLYRHVG